MDAPAPERFDLLRCRPGMETALVGEWTRKASLAVAPRIVGPGLVCGPVGSGSSRVPPMIFESERLPGAAFTPIALLKPISPATAAAALAPVVSHAMVWATVWETLGSAALAKRTSGIEKALLRALAPVDPMLARRQRRYAELAGTDGQVMRMVLTDDGLWTVPRPVSAGLPPVPPRMRLDPQAPSRSFLKIEEAFCRMGLEPRAGQRVVDLGAAPGGWTFACVKRGANVAAVDHGPLKIPRPQPVWGAVRHVRDDGLRYAPREEETPVDWMLSDMLVAPGVALGLLRKWMGGEWMWHFACNIKLPQQHPYAAVEPLEKFLRGSRAYRCELAQLYHDRREITVWGSLMDQAS